MGLSLTRLVLAVYCNINGLAAGKLHNYEQYLAEGWECTNISQECTDGVALSPRCATDLAGI